MIAARRPGWPTRTTVAAGVLVALAFAGCGTGPAPSGPWTRGSQPSPSSDPPKASPDRPSSDAPREPSLLVLWGRVGAMGLEQIDPGGAIRRPPPPDPGVAWISAATDGRLLATTLDGRAFLGNVDRDGPAWTELRPTGFDPVRLAGPLSFGTLSPDGRTAAFVAADFASTAPFEIVLVDVATGAGTPIRLAVPAEGAPPAWTSGRLLVLTRERADGAGIVIVDPTSRAIVEGPGPVEGAEPGAAGARTRWSDPIIALGVSANGSTVAAASGRDGRIVIGPADAFLAGRAEAAPDVGVIPDPGRATSTAWLAVAPAGDRLAIVDMDANGDAVSITIREARLGWTEVRRVLLPPGANRAVVAWLP